MELQEFIGQMPSKKEEVKAFSHLLKQEFDNATRIEKLRLLTICKMMTKAIEDTLSQDDVQEWLINAMDSKSEIVNGCELSIKETGVKYDYSVCADWREVSEQEKAAADVRKNIEKMLKSATENTPYVSANTGEVVPGVPKSSKTIVAVNIK